MAVPPSISISITGCCCLLCIYLTNIFCYKYAEDKGETKRGGRGEPEPKPKGVFISFLKLKRRRKKIALL